MAPVDSVGALDPVAFARTIPQMSKGDDPAMRTLPNSDRSAQGELAPPPRRGDFHEHQLDGDVVLQDPITQRVHLLNRTAREVWYRCNGRTTTRQIATELIQTHQVSFEAAVDHVEQLLALFAGNGLLIEEVTDDCQA